MQRVALWAVVALTLLVFVREGAAQTTVHLTAEEMKVALRTRDVEEDGFIERVLAQVAKGGLPEDMVQSTFLWARKKQRLKFQYFKQGLILRAADRGIVVR